MNGEGDSAGTSAAEARSESQRMRRDSQATMGAREELGSRYDEELIDDFLRRLDQSVDAHIDGRVAQQRGPRQSTPNGRRGPRRDLRLLLAALLLAIPLFAGSASFGAFMGVFVGVGSHSVGIGLVTALLVTVGTFSAGALALGVGALIYLDRRRA